MKGKKFMARRSKKTKTINSWDCVEIGTTVAAILLCIALIGAVALGFVTCIKENEMERFCIEQQHSWVHGNCLKGVEKEE